MSTSPSTQEHSVERDNPRKPIASGSFPKLHRIAMFSGLTLFGLGSDLWTKEVVFSWRGLPGQLPPHWIIENYVGIETAVNLGALFGLGQGFGLLFGAVSIIAAVGIVVWLFVFNACRSHWLTFALGLITGGIFGNLYDRLGFHGLQDQYSGGVRDWILLRYGTYTWPNFNIADSLLVVGAIMLAIYSFSNPEEANPSVQKSPDRSAT
jgi:signal peptidase II